MNGEFDSIMEDENTQVIGNVSYELAELTFQCHQGSVLREEECGESSKVNGGYTFNQRG